MRPTLIAVVLLSLMPVRPASAAESYDNCTGFVDSLPATISTQGTWCLRKDLATAINTGNAITVANNNVTLECNGFKLGGLAAGPNTEALGIRADNRLNLTVRGCSIRGFATGIFVLGGAGARIEGNLLDGNHYIGISVEAAASRIQDNTVTDTGGSPLAPSAAYGIIGAGGTDVIGNSISGVTVAGPNGGANGIFTANNHGGVVAGNRVRGLAAVGEGANYGIQDFGTTRAVFIDNILQDDSGHLGTGITCSDTGGVARDNTINGFVTSFVNCISSGNVFN